jgi:hypothetical protein
MLSIVLTKEEHQIFTNAWRKAVKYGTDYFEMTPEQVYEHAKKIYKDYPELIEASKKILFP